MDILFNKGAKSASPRPGGPAAAGPGAGDLVKEGSTQTFMTDVIEASMKHPVIVDFWASWCGPCKTLGPALERLVREAKGAVRMVKIDVDRNQDLAAQMRIQSIPAVYAFKNGRPVDGFVGAVPDSQLKAFIQRLTGPAQPALGLEDVQDEAKSLLAGGQAEQALELYRDILEAEPESPAALAGMVRCLIQLGETEEARRILAALPPELAGHAELIGARTALELSLEAGKVGPAADLRRALVADENDHQARFDLAMAYVAGGEREAAIEELLELYRRNRAWNEEAARKQLVKLFEAFGPTDPLTISARRRLSSLMFS